MDYVEEVSSLPTWHVSYYRQLLYRTTDGTLWYGNTSEWQRVNTGKPSDYISAIKEDSHAGTISPSVDNAIDHGKPKKRYANIYGVTFQGTTTTATYADLAEKYTTEIKHPVGTVLGISSNEEYDLELCMFGKDRYVGIVSENPAFLMDSKCDGQAIALIGKTPVRLIGSVYKGQLIMPSNYGVAQLISDPVFSKHKIGYTLETNLNKDEKLVTCLLR